MIGFTLAILGAILAAAFVFVCFLKALIWLVLLPIRVLAGLLAGFLVLPLLFVIVLVGGLLMLVIGPIILLALLTAIVAAVVSLGVTLFPLFCIAFVIWVVVRSGRPGSAIVRSH
jgi:hypothetical protein